MTKMAAIPAYGKHLSKSSFLNQTADDLETWYAGLVTQELQNLFRWLPLVDLDLFYKFGPFSVRENA